MKKKIERYYINALHSSYPAKNQDLNMNALDTLENLIYKLVIQIFTSQIPSLVSILKKCDYYEKHITINRSTET